MAAALAFDERSAEAEFLTQAFALYPPEVVCSEVLQKGVRDAGAGWCRGEVTVQQEHYATELAVRRVEALQVASPPPTRQQRVLVACAPHEDHAFSPLLFTFLLRRRGLDVEYLGANVPAQHLDATISAARPQTGGSRGATAAHRGDAGRCRPGSAPGACDGRVWWCGFQSFPRPAFPHCRSFPG